MVDTNDLTVGTPPRGWRLGNEVRKNVGQISRARPDIEHSITWFEVVYEVLTCVAMHVRG